MLEILIIMCSGILTGKLLRGKTGILTVVEKLTALSIYLLLFLLGISVGINEKIINSFPLIGFRAIILTMSGIAGSVILAWVLYLSLFRKKEGQ